MTHLIDIGVIILGKLSVWKEVEQVWDKYHDLDVETKSFIQLLQHVPFLENFHDKLVEFDSQRKRSHTELMKILQATSDHIMASVNVLSLENVSINTNGDDSLYQ